MLFLFTDKGQLFGWGNSEYGQLKIATSETQLHTPRHLPFSPELGKFTDIATSGTSCLVLNGTAIYIIFLFPWNQTIFFYSDKGEVFVWGYGILGKGPKVEDIGYPSPIPLTLFGRNEFNDDCKVISVYGGLSQFAAVTNTGDLYIWGRNRFGSLGLGHLDNQFFPLKVNKSLSVTNSLQLIIISIDKFLWYNLQVSVPAFVKKISIGVDHCAALCKSYA